MYNQTAVCGMYPNVAVRHYGGLTCRSVEFYRELGARVVIASAARAAARTNKGVKVLCTVFRDHYLFISLQVLRGPQHADISLSKISRLYYCNDCKFRAFDNRSKCSCTGNVEMMELGPCWTDRIFDSATVTKMVTEAETRDDMKTNKPFTKLLTVMKEESEAHLPFYYNLHNFGSGNIPKVKKVVQLLKEEGYTSTRTHFEPKAIRTNAPVQAVQAILEKAT